MFFEQEKLILDGHEILLRKAEIEDAPLLVEYLRTVSGETRFLSKEADEIDLTLEQEVGFIEKMSGPENLLIIALSDGEYAGNCSFCKHEGSRRYAHRAKFGIALFQKFTGFGLGRVLTERAVECAKKLGYEQLELTVVSSNERAHRLYQSFGFEEYGRLPNANKYDDGAYSDDIFMIKRL
ncbi:MAG: GNAT family N-acetyltransferase [Bacteroides sp.]|nr:GNAT family N-acetyltransferase [Bacteroides sp.]